MSVVPDTEPPRRRADAVGDYHPSAAVYDEFKDAAGEVRPAWSALAKSLVALGRDEMRERRENARELLKEHGVTYNVYADGRSDERQWQLDVLPFVLSAEEWIHLKAGLEQRTRLLDGVLRDLYGPQQLLRDRVVPPALIQANPGFLRPCHGVVPPGGRFLTFHAVDLTRAPNGEWWVLADRTQAPSGIGYTLENRSIISRILPEELRTAHAQALGPFFTALKAGLRSLAPWTDSPTIALLTPGPFTETYFEHAYLARHLGFALVEGGDLAVRNRRVFLKTLEGLQPVDVILRRVDDTFCDPLELRTDSFLGVPGLVDAARAGTVAISNALGSGAVEAPALLAFLPALARHLLDEDLLIPNVATWWCGQQFEREYTLANLQNLVIKSAFVSAASAPVFGEETTGAKLDQLVARIRDRPHDYVGQERVALSTAPVWKTDRLLPHPLILRCFICATPDGYQVLPGGLTRVSGSPESPVVTSRHGGGSKDTWVLPLASPEPSRGEPLPEEERHHGRGTLPSRFAENLYWLGRYTERLEDNVRLLRTALGRLAGESAAMDEEELWLVKLVLVELEKLPSILSARLSRANLLLGLQGLIFTRGLPGSAIELVERIRILTASLRDRFSGDTWRILNQLQTDFHEAPTRGGASVHSRTLHRLIFHLAAFNGMEMENMTRGTSWRFLELGRRLERASNLLETICAMMKVDPGGKTGLIPLLEYSDSIMTYRRRHFARPNLPTTLELLLADDTNPRSLTFQLRAIGKHLGRLPGSSPQQPEIRQFARVAKMAEEADLYHPAVAGEKREEFLGVIYGISQELALLSDVLSERFFSHVMPRVS